MNKKQISDLINEGFGNLYPLTYATYTDYRAEMLDDELKQEKRHRAFISVAFKPKFSASIVSKYWVILAIRTAMLSDHFRPRDILHCKKSYILAHAIKDDDRFDLDAMFDGFDWEAFESIDYRQGDLFIKADSVEVAA